MSLRLPRLITSVIAAALSIAMLLGAPAVAQKSSPTNASPPSNTERIQRIEANLVSIPMSGDQPPLQFNLSQLMKALNVPGLTVTVIDDFKPAWTKTYGVTEAGTTMPVTPRTLFQAGSISKPVTATGALALVEHGKMSLDANINDYLKSWKVPDNDFTTTQKVTLRRLLSHTAGLTVHGFPGYAVGEPIPTLPQIFNGEKPANNEPIRVDFVPGSKVRYSGGGTTIVQQAIIDVTGKPFPEFMHETVLGPIGMKESTYQQPLPSSLAVLAASGTRADGTTVPGKWHIYPEMAAAGLWTTSSDLAKFAIHIAQSKNGKANKVLTESMTRQMLTPQLDGAGLGFFLNAGGNPNAFGHNGADEGFQAILVMISDTGQGAAIMANSDNGVAVGNYVINSVAREYGWKYAPQKDEAAGVLSLVEMAKGGAAAIQEYHYLRENAASSYNFDEGTLNQLGYQLLSKGETKDAIQVFQMNVQEYPKSWNCYDSLGEAYMKAGQKDLAIQNYTKSIELNPDNKNGVEMLKKLKEQK
jgi:CubicO group peptidase (beta-lactamase class C family)